MMVDPMSRRLGVIGMRAARRDDDELGIHATQLLRSTTDAREVDHGPLFMCVAL